VFVSDKQLVYKSNAVIEASYRLTVMEQRVILAAITQIRRDELITDKKMYEISTSDLKLACGKMTSGAFYKDMKAAVNQLYDRSVTILRAPNGGAVHDEPISTRWLQTKGIVDARGVIKIRFSHDILPYLNQLTTEFTSYAMADVLNLTGAYAFRLHELMAQYRKAGERVISIDDLRLWLVLENKYGALCDLKKRVIDPAVQQINEKTPLRVKYTQERTKKTVTHLRFKIKDTSEPKRKRKYTEKDLLQNNQLAKPGENTSDALDRLNGA
jgi:plasmid replication initiation protein